MTDHKELIAELRASAALRPGLYELLAQAADALEEAGRDAERLDAMDKANAKWRMGWGVHIAPAGNWRVDSVVFLGKPVVTIREAIDAALINSQKDR